MGPTENAHPHPEAEEAPQFQFGASRLLLVGTGAIGAAFLPFWLNWCRQAVPHVSVRVLLTYSAERFVTRQALAAIGDEPVMQDRWPDEPQSSALHVELAEWADAIAVYPATMHFLGRFSAGLADTPSLLAAQCTSAPVGIAPSLPPGGGSSPAYRGAIESLGRRDNVVIADPRPGRSATTGRGDAMVAAPLPLLLSHIELLRTTVSGATRGEEHG